MIKLSMVAQKVTNLLKKRGKNEGEIFNIFK